MGGITQLKVKILLDFAKSQIVEEKIARFVPQTFSLDFYWYKNKYFLQMKFHTAGKNHVIYIDTYTFKVLQLTGFHLFLISILSKWFLNLNMILLCLQSS